MAVIFKPLWYTVHVLYLKIIFYIDALKNMVSFTIIRIWGQFTYNTVITQKLMQKSKIRPDYKLLQYYRNYNQTKIDELYADINSVILCN